MHLFLHHKSNLIDTYRFPDCVCVCLVMVNMIHVLISMRKYRIYITLDGLTRQRTTSTSEFAAYKLCVCSNKAKIITTI